MKVYRRIEVAPIAGALGAEISGVDLATDVADETVAEIRRAWLEHLVVFFRDQVLGTRRFLAFAAAHRRARGVPVREGASTVSPRSSPSRSFRTRP